MKKSEPPGCLAVVLWIIVVASVSSILFDLYGAWTRRIPETSHVIQQK